MKGNLEARLQKFGLNSYEARAYIALLKSGISGSLEISTEGAVPYGKIYPVLFSLEKKGFVKVFEGKPKRFMAIQPSVILDSVKEKRQRELSTFEQETSKLIRIFESFSSVKPKSTEESIQIIKGRKNYLNFSIMLHKRAEREWRSVATTCPVYKPHLEAYRKNVKEGIDVRVITSTSQEPAKVDAWLKTGLKLRFIEDLPIGFAIIDLKEVVLRISDTPTKGYIAVWIQSPILARTLADYFDRLWEISSSNN